VIDPASGAMYLLANFAAYIALMPVMLLVYVIHLNGWWRYVAYLFGGYIVVGNIIERIIL